MQVFNEYDYPGREGDALAAWLFLYPGKVEDDVTIMLIKKHGGLAEVAELTGEYFVWYGLFLAGLL